MTIRTATEVTKFG